jgi:hypothetical protein
VTLLSRLRAAYSGWPLDVKLLREAADRIEALERLNDTLRTQTHRRDPVTGRILPKGK